MSLGRLKIILFFTLIALIGENTYAQTSISGVINNYAKVTAINSSCSTNNLTLAATTGFNIGDRVLLIQMKGATVNGTNSSSSFGNITAIGNAGNYEFNEILDIQGLVVYLKYTLINTYNPVGLQLIYVPQYSDVIISGTLTATPWSNGVGGVLVFEASGNVEFNADINVEGLGFRGGNINADNSVNSCGYGTTTALAPFYIFYSAALGFKGVAEKGEGISEYITGSESGRGNQANAGGSGHSSNTGAGGGSNYGKGGIGGRQSRTTTGGGCGSTVGGQGLGGLALSSYYASNKIFLGGGGGGGQQNNYMSPGPAGNSPGSSPGNPGGGIVIIRSGSINGNGHGIYAGGLNERCLIRTTLGAYNPTNHLKRGFGDSGGGGGGGGTILLSTSNYTSALTTDVRGGRGDTVYTEVSIDLGPGAGGGGGVVWVNSASLDANITTMLSGGVSGISWNPDFPAVCQCAFQATNGDPGTVLNNLVLPESTTPFSNTCTSVPITLLDFTGKENNGKILLNWSTAMELDNDRFVLEKSIDGSTYQYLTTIDGGGNSSTLLSYSYVDYYPNNGANYYRLKQYDFNGTEHTDGHVYVQFSGSGEVIEKLYPNPFADELILEGSAPFRKEQTILNFYDVLGSEISSVISASYGGQKITLQTSGLSKGVYLLKITSGNKTETRRVIKE